MLSIDEAIEVHKKLLSTASKYNDRRGVFYTAEEHEQLAEWLEELKKSRKGFEENRKAGYKHGYSDGYSKAIDDFAKRLKHEHNQTITTESVYIGRSFDEVVDEIAEQLKAGGENETT